MGVFCAFPLLVANAEYGAGGETKRFVTLGPRADTRAKGQRSRTRPLCLNVVATPPNAAASTAGSRQARPDPLRENLRRDEDGG